MKWMRLAPLITAFCQASVITLGTFNHIKEEVVTLSRQPESLLIGNPF